MSPTTASDYSRLAFTYPDLWLRGIGLAFNPRVTTRRFGAPSLREDEEKTMRRMLFAATIALLVCLFSVLAACGGDNGKNQSNNPVPVLTALSPTTATVGGAAFTLTVSGSGFVAGSAVHWNAAARTTMFVSATQLTAAILSADLANAGTAQITVVNPTPGGGTSSAITFTIQPSGSAEGLWRGTTSSDRTIAGLVLGSGEYWFIYSAVGNGAVIAGAVQGNGTSQSGRFTSSDGIDFNFEGAGNNPVTIDATYVPKNSLDGTVQDTGATSSLTFTTAYQFEYGGTPIMEPLITTFTGTAYAGLTEYTEVTIAASGALTGVSASGCTFSGTLTPSTDGNYYNVTVTFQGGACVNGTSTVTGVAFFEIYSRRLTSAALNATRTSGFVFDGVGPPY